MNKKYHEELVELDKIIDKNHGYWCGRCEECEEVYKYFLKMIRRIKCPSEPEIIISEFDARPKVDLTKLHCVNSNAQKPQKTSGEKE